MSSARARPFVVHVFTFDVDGRKAPKPSLGDFITRSSRGSSTDRRAVLRQSTWMVGGTNIPLVPKIRPYGKLTSRSVAVTST